MLDDKIKQYFENPRKLVKIEADEMFCLHLIFDNGEERFYSLENKLEGVFSVLKDKEKFQSVDEFGNAAWDIDASIDSKVHWENRIDICKDALYMDSIPSEQKLSE